MPWVVGYQRGEIIALVQRVRELERLARRRSIVLAGIMGLIALIAAGSVGYWLSNSMLAPSEAAVPVVAAASGAREPARSPPTSVEQATLEDAEREIVGKSRQSAGSLGRSPPAAKAVRREARLTSLESGDTDAGAPAVGAAFQARRRPVRPWLGRCRCTLPPM